MNVNSLKPAPSRGELDPHNERDNDINRVYKSLVLLEGLCRRQVITGTIARSLKIRVKNLWVRRAGICQIKWNYLLFIWLELMRVHIHLYMTKDF